MKQSPPNDIYENIRYEVRIPKSRIAVLVGTKGETKRHIEEQTDTEISIDSKEGDVIIQGKDVVNSFVVKDIVKAIGRGFNPEFALRLLKPDYTFELIELGESMKHKNQLLRVKGRVIGKEGKTRELIEKLMEVHMSVYGKTIGILGEVSRVVAAKQAVNMLLGGSPHANVYKWLERKRRALTQEELSGSKTQVKDEYKKYV